MHNSLWWFVVGGFELLYGSRGGMDRWDGLGLFVSFPTTCYLRPFDFGCSFSEIEISLLACERFSFFLSFFPSACGILFLEFDTPSLFVSSSFHPGFHPAVPRAMDLAVGLEGRESWRVGVWLVEGCDQVCCWWRGGGEREKRGNVYWLVLF